VENLYYEVGDGEISIYRGYANDYGQECEQESFMVISIDISTLYKEKRGKAIDLIEKLSKIKDENLVEIYSWWYIEDQVIFVETETPLNINPVGEEKVVSKVPISKVKAEA
jgi:hypothetical protein